MKYTINYAEMENHEADQQAVSDMAEYLGEERMALIVEYVQGATTTGEVSTIINALAMAGVSGRPPHALCRKYCLNLYREYMAEEVNGGSVQTDEEGFRL